MEFAYIHLFICVSNLFGLRRERLVFQDNLSCKSETDHTYQQQQEIRRFISYRKLKTKD